TIVGVPHHNWNTVVAYSIECVFVGNVVAEIDRHQGTRAGVMQVIDHPAKCFSLVPVDIRTQLNDFATGGHSKRVVLTRRAHRCGYLANAVTGGVAIVYGYTESLVLHHNTGNRPELVS